MKPADLVFFGSGAAALVYQTVWARLLARLLGSGSTGTAVVLGIFMGGMAIGAFLGGGLVRRAERPVRMFVAIEVMLALWAAASPHILTAIDPVDGVLARGGVAALALLGPTVLMGITFPLMGRLVIERREDTGRETAGFYGANTVGAAVGALVGPFVLMPELGLSGALYAAAALELGVALLATTVFRGRAAAPPGEQHGGEAHGAGSLAREPFVWAAALMGASALALEVILTRILITATGASIYAFAIVLAVFLLGIGLGSRGLDGGDDETRAGYARRFAKAAALVPALSLAGLLALGLRLDEKDLFAGLSNRMPGGTGVQTLWFAHAVWAALAVLGPAVAFGRALPSAVAGAALGRSDAERERVLGTVYGANTVGSLVGALGAGLVLLPLVGPRLTLVAALLLAVLAALLGAYAQADRGVFKFLSFAGLAAALFGGLTLVPREGTAKVLTLAHGPHATVSVEEVQPPGAAAPVRSLRVNGKVVATSGPVDMRLQRLLAAIPATLHGQVETAIVIGMGTGMTAGTLLDLSTLKSLDVVEISAVVPWHGAAPFAQWNGALLDDSRTRVIHEDGRHHLARTDQRFDLVTSDPIHPWTAGSSDLYTVDHFRQMAQHLAPGGIASQWLPLYQLSDEDVKTVIASWVASFPEASAWLTAYDLVLVGANEGLAGPAELVSQTLAPALAASLDEAGVGSAAELAALFVADDASLRAYAEGTAPMTDDFPVLEFRAPRSFLAGYSVAALRWAGRAEVVEGLPEVSRARAAQVRALLDTFLSDLPGGWSRAATRYGEALLELP